MTGEAVIRSTVWVGRRSKSRASPTQADAGGSKCSNSAAHSSASVATETQGLRGGWMPKTCCTSVAPTHRVSDRPENPRIKNMPKTEPKPRSAVRSTGWLGRFLRWLNQPDPVEQQWSERKSPMVRISFEFGDGETRELVGEAADEWWHDLHRRNCGRHPDWTRHKWKVHRPNDSGSPARRERPKTMNTPQPPKQDAAAPGSVKPAGSATCAVDECHSPAACELAIDGEWFPVCREHAINRMLPRRPLSSPNDPDQRPGAQPQV